MPEVTARLPAPASDAPAIRAAPFYPLRHPRADFVLADGLHRTYLPRLTALATAAPLDIFVSRM